MTERRPPPWKCYACNDIHLSLWASAEMRQKRDDSLCDYHHKKYMAEKKAWDEMVIDPSKLTFKDRKKLSKAIKHIRKEHRDRRHD